LINAKEIKEISIKEYLERQGVPTHRNGNKVFCSSPFSRDTNWSFCIYPSNTYFDWSTGQHGDIITLVRKIENCSFLEALEKLSSSNLSRIQPIEYKRDENFWKDFDYTKYLSRNPEEIQAIKRYAKGREITEGYEAGVFFTREIRVHRGKEEARWVLQSCSAIATKIWKYAE